MLPGVRTVADLEAGRFDNPCPTCGQALGWELVDEDARLDPRSSYAASKLATEHYASAWVRQADARAVGLRYHNVYGARMPRDTPYSGVAAIFRSSLERGESPRVFEDGGQMRDFVHVTDVARANLASIEAVTAGSGDDALAAYEAFNVCSGEPVSIRDVAQMLGAASGIEPVVTGQYRLGDVRHVVASPERARRVWASARRSCPRRDWRPSSTSRCAPDAPEPVTRYQVVRSRCWITSAAVSWIHTPRRRHRSGSSAQPSSTHGTNGSQIRSTSALLICDRSAVSTVSTPASVIT